MNNKIAIVDIETTGPRYEKGDKIIQIACVIIEDNCVKAEYSMYINPEIDIPINIQHLTGIKQSDVKNAPTIQSVITLWYERLNDCIFIAHNTNFDLRFLEKVFEEHHLSFNPQFIDTVILSKVFFPTAHGFNLLELSEHLNIPFSDSHNALADAKFTTQLLQKIALKIKNLNSNILMHLQKFSAYLPGNYDVIFNNPDFFLIYDKKIYVESKPHINDKNKCSDKNSQEIHKQILSQEESNVIYQAPYSIIQSQSNIDDLMGKHSSRMGYITHDIVDLLQKYSSESDNLVVLLNYNEYIHVNAFNYVVSNYSFHSVNQQEIVTILAVMYWLTYTKTGIIYELNKEFKINEIVQKITPSTILTQSHMFYKQAYNKIYNSKIWVSTTANFISMINSEETNLQYLLSSHIYINDIDRFLNTLHLKTLNSFSISLFLQKLNLLKENQYERLLNYQLISSVDVLINKLNNLVENLETYALTQIESFSDRQLNHYIPLLNNKERNAFIYNELNQAIEDILNFKAKIMSNRLENTSYFSDIYYSSIYLMDYFKRNPIHFLSLSQFKQYTFDYEIIGYCKDRFRRTVEYMCNFDKVSILSSERSQYMIYKTVLNQFTKIKALDSEPIDIKIDIPITYLSDSINDQISLVKDYIHTELINSKQNIIILVSNKDQVSQIYEALANTSQISKKYSIFSEGITGSVNKIHRRMKESKLFISILKINSYKSTNIECFNKHVLAFIVNFPFKSNALLINQIKRHYIDSPQMLFDQVIYPDMLTDLNVILTRLDEFYILDEVVMFDERILTKRYSYHLRKQLELSYDLKFSD